MPTYSYACTECGDRFGGLGGVVVAAGVGEAELVFGHRRVEQQRQVRLIGKVERLQRQVV